MKLINNQLYKPQKITLYIFCIGKIFCVLKNCVYICAVIKT